MDKYLEDIQLGIFTEAKNLDDYDAAHALTMLMYHGIKNAQMEYDGDIEDTIKAIGFRNLQEAKLNLMNIFDSEKHMNVNTYFKNVEKAKDLGFKYMYWWGEMGLSVYFASKKKLNITNKKYSLGLLSDEKTHKSMMREKNEENAAKQENKNFKSYVLKLKVGDTIDTIYDWRQYGNGKPAKEIKNAKIIDIENTNDSRTMRKFTVKNGKMIVKNVMAIIGGQTFRAESVK